MVKIVVKLVQDAAEDTTREIAKSGMVPFTLDQRLAKRSVVERTFISKT